MRIETVLLVSVVVVAAVLTSATAEYVWNGSEWVWKEKEVRGNGFTNFQRTHACSNLKSFTA